MICSFLSAFSFLTIIPVQRGKPSEKDLGRAPIWFPLVGYFLGGVCFSIARFLFGKIPLDLVAFLILLFLVIITGALHLDGLADWADSLAGKDQEQRLKIMKDYHHGSFGIIALLLLILAKFIILKLLVAHQNFLTLFLAPGLSRLSLCLIINLGEYARPQGGMALVFSQGKKRWHLLVGFALTLIPVLGFKSLSALIGLGIVLLCSLLFYYDGKRRLGGFTGDLLGACLEVCEVIVLFSAIIFNSLNKF